MSFAAPARDQVGQLKNLGDLKSRGILSDAEFDAQKAKNLRAPEQWDVNELESEQQKWGCHVAYAAVGASELRWPLPS